LNWYNINSNIFRQSRDPGFAGKNQNEKERAMGKRKRRGKLSWRSKKANKGRKPNLG
jgi:hypothetical protein